MACHHDIPCGDDFDDRDLPQEQDLDDEDSPFDDDADDDSPRKEDVDDEEDESLGDAICPSCREVVTEDTQKCPHCGDWITPEHPASHGWRRWFFVVVVLVMLWAVLRWMGVM
jgi:hypothetical protein